MSVDILYDDSFTIPFDKPDAPSCPVCDGHLVVDVDERCTETRMPSETGFLVWCEKEDEHRNWDYGELLSAIEETRRWFEAECERRRAWEVCLWGKADMPRLEETSYAF